MPLRFDEESIWIYMVYPMHESKMKGFDEQRNKNSFTVSIAHVVQKATKGGGDHDGG